MTKFYYTVIKCNDGEIKIWKSLGEDRFESPLYEVLGYSTRLDGAIRMAHEAYAEVKRDRTVKEIAPGLYFYPAL